MADKSVPETFQHPNIGNLEKTIEFIHIFEDYLGIETWGYEWVRNKSHDQPFIIISDLSQLSRENDSNAIGHYLMEKKLDKIVSLDFPLIKFSLNKESKKADIFLLRNYVFSPINTRLSDPDGIDQWADYSVEDRKILSAIIERQNELSNKLLKLEKDECKYDLTTYRNERLVIDIVDLSKYDERKIGKHAPAKETVFICGESCEHILNGPNSEPVILVQAILNIARPVFGFKNYACNVWGAREEKAKKYLEQ